VRALLNFQPLSLGFDYYSLDPPSATTFPAHLEAARRAIPVFVCLDLSEVSPGEYFFSALPLRIEKIEGIPVRAVLFRK
jgi:arylformamidase